MYLIILLVASMAFLGCSEDTSKSNSVIPKKANGPAKEDVSMDDKPEDQVVVNGHALSRDELDTLSGIYGMRPLPGEYWYDPVSGLYGAVGHDAYGFMHPGHDFGPPAPFASGGNTSVSVNGRILSKEEYVVWSHILGAWIQPGAYWLDGQGNAGYEGNAYPVVNLYQAAMNNHYKGQGASGDNFWSTRFSAGNSNQGNTQGYVSVPGHGPVGYGF